MKRILLFLLLTIAAPAAAGVPWSFNWSLAPGQPPAPWIATSSAPGITGWDVLRHVRGPGTYTNYEPTYESFMAHHDLSTCANSDPTPPTHMVNTYSDTTFLCSNHMMTGTFSSEYALTAFTPSQLVDFSTGPALITWRVSTMHPTSNARDWMDVMLADFNSAFSGRVEPDILDAAGCPVVAGVDFTGYPKNSLVFDMRASTVQYAFISDNNFCARKLAATSPWPPIFDNLTTPSSVIRSKFEMSISTTHVRIGMYYQNVSPQPPNVAGDCDPLSTNYCLFNWVDRDIVPALTWNKAVVSWSHHSYNPWKDDATGLHCTPSQSCGPNTWHWSDFTISNAQPFTILNGDIQSVHGTTVGTVTFPSAAPAGSTLRFEATGATVEYSLDRGVTWQAALKAPIAPALDTPSSPADIVRPYATPIPAGTTSVMLRGTDAYSWSPFHLRDITIWAP